MYDDLSDELATLGTKMVSILILHKPFIVSIVSI